MNKYIHFICLMTVDAMLIASTVLQIPMLGAAASLFAAFIIVCGNKMQSFYTILATCLMAGCCNIGSIGFYFILMLLAYFKIDGKALPAFKYTPFVVFLLLVMILHELRYSTIGYILYYCSYLLYLFKILSIVDWKGYDHRYATVVFLLSIIFTQIGATLLTGDLTMLSDETNTTVRFGEGDVENGANNNLGGAMNFPVQTLMFMTFSLPLIFGRWLKLLWKTFAIAAFVTLFVITFFTTSRVYILGLGTMSLMLMAMLMGRDYGFVVKIAVIALAVSAVYVFFSTGLSDLVLLRYEIRNSSDTGMLSSRDVIAKDCITYLTNHPLALLFGEGYKSYGEIGKQLHLAFQMSAHNSILDCIMAYGLYGFTLIIFASKNFFTKIKANTQCERVSIMGLMPLACWFMMSLTNSSFMLPQTYVLIPFMLLHLKYYKTLINKDSGNI